MIKVLVTDVGRSPALNFCRSLRLSNEDIFIVGIDTNKYSLTWAEADIKYLSPDYKNEKYLAFLNYIIDLYDIDLVYPSKTGGELLFLARNQEKIHAPLFLPEYEDIKVFEDKWKTYNFIKEKELCQVPKTYLVHNKKELYFYMKELTNDFSKEAWIRRIYGSGGAGSIPTNDYLLAKAWIDRNNGWGKFTISEKLTSQTMTWSGLWKNGKLIVSQARERLYWEFADRAPSGVTGITGAQRVIDSYNLDEISIRVIKAFSRCPNGCICVDYTMDEKGNPNLTEIQASRLYTSTHFLAKCGVNLPYIFCKLALDLPIDDEEIKPAKNHNMLWLKYVETYPQLVSEEEIQKEIYETEQILEKL